MKELTRRQVINWCLKKKVRFSEPLGYPPEGWLWVNTDQFWVISPRYCNRECGEDVTPATIIFEHARRAVKAQRLADKRVLTDDQNILPRTKGP